LREHRLLRATVFLSSSGYARLRADSSPARGGVSVIGKIGVFGHTLGAVFGEGKRANKGLFFNGTRLFFCHEQD
jgi:hypothetical protein